MSLCQAIKSDGTPCNAPAINNSDFCFQHDPERQTEAEEARKKGSRIAAERARAKNRDKVDKEPLKTFRLRSLDDVSRLLASTINEFRSGRISADEARCTAYVANILISAIKNGDIEARLEKLEERVTENKRDQWVH